jgi:hypothetical protein
MPLISNHPWLFSFLVLFVFFMAWPYLTTLKNIIKRQRLVNLELRPGPPLGLPGLDEAKLDSVTQEFESLGFVRLGDYLSRNYFSEGKSGQAVALSGQGPPIADPAAEPTLPPDRFPPQGFARVMLHPEHSCLGKIIFVSVVDAQGKVPTTSTMMATIVSLDAGDGGWTYTTSNRQSTVTVNALMKMMRHPRWLSTRMPDSSPQELLKVHIARRIDIAQAAGITWKPNLTLADDLDYEQRSVENIRTLYNGLTPLKMAWRLHRLKREKESLEWLGELARRVPGAR